MEELVSQRVYGLALGYEDLNDHDELRRDPVVALLAGKSDVGGQQRRRERDRGQPLAGKSTLNRLERTSDGLDRYKKIRCDSAAIDRLLVDVFVEAQQQEPAEIILDIDATDTTAMTSLFLRNACLPCSTYCSSTPARAKRRAPRPDGHLTHFASPRGEKCRLFLTALSGTSPRHVVRHAG